MKSCIIRWREAVPSTSLSLPLSYRGTRGVANCGGNIHSNRIVWLPARAWLARVFSSAARKHSLGTQRKNGATLFPQKLEGGFGRRKKRERAKKEKELRVEAADSGWKELSGVCKQHKCEGSSFPWRCVVVAPLGYKLSALIPSPAPPSSSPPSSSS